MNMNEIRPLTQQDVLEALDLLRPWATRRTPKVRVGNDYDGGYVLPAVALQCDVVLSIGVGHDVSFDHVMAERGARILQFDHTVEGPPTPHANFIFDKKGWASDLRRLRELCGDGAAHGCAAAQACFAEVRRGRRGVRGLADGGRCRPQAL